MPATEVSKRGPLREISLTSITPRVTSWTPCDKIQVRVAEDGLAMHTYTPVRWENTTGDATILVYLHGAGPGSAWGQGVAAGDAVQIVGPRRSMDLTRFTSALIFVGDETSVGFASRGRPLTQTSYPCATSSTCAPTVRLRFVHSDLSPSAPPARSQTVTFRCSSSTSSPPPSTASRRSAPHPSRLG